MLKLLILLGIILLVSLLFEYCICIFVGRINKPTNIIDNESLPARRTHVKYKPLRAVVVLHYTTW